MLLRESVFREQESAEIGHALDLALIQHIDDAFDDSATGLAGSGRQRETDLTGNLLWFALVADFVGDQFQQFIQVQPQRLSQAFQHPGRRILLSPLNLSHIDLRSEEHTSELQSRENLVCRLLLEKKKKK